MKIELRIAFICALVFGSFLIQAQEEGETESSETEASDAMTIWQAAAAGDLEALETAVNDDGADVNGSDPADGSSPLMVAAREGQAVAVEWLLENGAEVNAQDGNGTSALMAASFLGYGDVARVLIREGANVTLQNYEGQGPIEMLQVPWQITNAIANDYLRLGVTEEEVSAGREVVGKLLEEAYMELAKTNIWIAISFGNADLVKESIKNGAEVNEVEPGGSSPLLIAAVANNTDMVSALIDAGANLDAQNTNNGATALVAATFFGHHEIAKILIEAGADPSIADFEGYDVAATLTRDYATTAFIANALSVAIENEETLMANRKQIGDLLPTESDEPEASEE